MINIEYINRRGVKVKKSYTREDALSRLEYLVHQERITQRYAPTDSGDVRYNYNREEEAIGDAL